MVQMDLPCHVTFKSDSVVCQYIFTCTFLYYFLLLLLLLFFSFEALGCWCCFKWRALNGMLEMVTTGSIPASGITYSLFDQPKEQILLLLLYDRVYCEPMIRCCFDSIRKNFDLKLSP